MGVEAEITDDPAFQQLLATRSRLRWSFSSLIIGVYLGFGIAGVYLPEKLAAPFPGGVMPWGLVMGFSIIALSIALSMIYVRVINRLEAENTFAKWRN